MAIKLLDEEYRKFFNKYSARELFDLIFTDYKNSPSELAKIPNLQNLAKQRVSQIVDAAGIKTRNIKDIFEIVQEVVLQVEIVAEEAAAAEAVAEASSGASDGGGGGG